jgi:hypothetical protein
MADPDDVFLAALVPADPVVNRRRHQEHHTRRSRQDADEEDGTLDARRTGQKRSFTCEPGVRSPAQPSLARRTVDPLSMKKGPCVNWVGLCIAQSGRVVWSGAVSLAHLSIASSRGGQG